MFDHTFAGPINPHADGQLPFDEAFPLIANLCQDAGISPPDTDSAHWVSRPTEVDLGRLVAEVYDAYAFAQYVFPELDNQRLGRAYIEARFLASSLLFGDELYPSVSVDEHGEITFSHRSDSGYVDIGVRGEGVLSYHVRNDVDPEKTEFDDYDWSDFDIPMRLYSALQALRQHL